MSKIFFKLIYGISIISTALMILAFIFSYQNVLDYPAIREGIKKYADWPTIPQLYAHGEFIGGCDIVTSMHEAGELKEVLDPASSK